MWLTSEFVPSVEHRRKLAQREFVQAFVRIQETSYQILRQHKVAPVEGTVVARTAKKIRKCALSLTRMLGYSRGNKAAHPAIFRDPHELDSAVHQLAVVVHRFAHNPIHRTRTLVNAKDVTRARDDLHRIVCLSEAIEHCAKTGIGLECRPSR